MKKKEQPSRRNTTTVRLTREARKELEKLAIHFSATLGERLTLADTLEMAIENLKGIANGEFTKD